MLRCTRDCFTAQRRSQLADAFGVPPQSDVGPAGEGYVSYFDRHRTPNYPASLITVRWVTVRSQ